MHDGREPAAGAQDGKPSETRSEIRDRMIPPSFGGASGRDSARPAPDLAAALRTARAQDAERTYAINDLRILAMTRLTLLRDALAPVLRQIPDDVDLFDVGLMPGDPPRLFIDMIAFVEIGHDRHFRLFQNRRHGRVMIAEADTVDRAVDAVTAYIARRLVERDKALASDLAAAQTEEPLVPPGTLAEKTGFRTPSARWPLSGWYILGQVFWFIVEVLGLLTLFGAVLLGLHGAWLAFGLR